jgi:predicted N-acetyltransferase YhbS
MQILPLKQRPNLAAQLAGLHAAEWGHLYTDWTEDAALHEFLNEPKFNRLPATLVAVEGRTLLGSVSVIYDDLPGWQHLNPWVASLYVVKRERGKGIGGVLLSAAEALLRSHRVLRAHVFTEHHATYFQRFGWLRYANSKANGHAVVILIKELNPVSRCRQPTKKET